MCGRYYIDPDTEEEIWKIVRNIDRKKGLIRCFLCPVNIRL